MSALVKECYNTTIMHRHQQGTEAISAEADKGSGIHIPGLEPHGPPIDAAAAPDFDEIERNFKKTLADRENLDATVRAAFREINGGAEGIYLPGAVGNRLFQSFGDDEYATRLHQVVKAALREEFVDPTTIDLEAIRQAD